MKKDKKTHDIDAETIATKIAGLKPLYSDRLPEKLLSVLPIIEGKINDGVTITDMAKEIGYDRFTFGRALKSARKKRDKLNAANGQPPTMTRNPGPAEAAAPGNAAPIAATPTAAPQAEAQGASPPDMAHPEPKPEPEPGSRAQAFKDSLIKVSPDWDYEKHGKPARTVMVDGCWVYLPKNMGRMQFLSKLSDLQDADSNERKYGAQRRLLLKMRAEAEAEKAEAEKAEAEKAEAEKTEAEKTEAEKNGGKGGAAAESTP